MEDIELACSLLKEKGLNLVIVKGRQVLFSSGESGVAPFFRAVQNMENNLHNAAAADRIVGLAVAMLCLHVRIASVYADIMSQGALDALKKQGVTINSKSVVPHIFDYDGTDLCPFEKLAQSCGAPSKLLAALQSLFAAGGQ
jgi:hypothetical protein